MNAHKKLLEEKFSHAKEDLYYNSGGNLMWSLFRTQSEGVTIYYHETEDFHIIGGNTAQHYSIHEIAEKWDPFSKQLID